MKTPSGAIIAVIALSGHCRNTIKWITTRSNAADAQWKRDRDAVTFIKFLLIDTCAWRDNLYDDQKFHFRQQNIKILRFIDDNILPKIQLNQSEWNKIMNVLKHAFRGDNFPPKTFYVSALNFSNLDRFL